MPVKLMFFFIITTPFFFSLSSVDYETFDILEDEEVIKSFHHWCLSLLFLKLKFTVQVVFLRCGKD